MINTLGSKKQIIVQALDLENTTHDQAARITELEAAMTNAARNQAASNGEERRLKASQKALTARIAELTAALEKIILAFEGENRADDPQLYPDEIVFEIARKALKQAEG